MRRTSRTVLALAMIFAAGHAYADQDTVRIGVLTDMSGQMADLQGQGAVEAVKLAVADFGGRVNGKPIEVIAGDNQLKPDVAISLLRQWYESRGVDAVIELSLSNIGLAAQGITREMNKVVLLTSPATVELYREKCSPNTVDWPLDNYTYGHAVPSLILRNGGKKWFMLVTDYAFGINMQAIATDTVVSEGGQVMGSVRHPLNTSDYSSYLLQAQGSGANVLAFINSNMDLANSLKQAREFGLDRTMQFVAPANAFNIVVALGLNVAQGMTVVDPMYWDLNDATRAFAKRFEAVMGKPPSGNQFLDYSAALHYLKGVQAAGGPVDGAAVVRKMKEIPISDPVIHGRVREDGRAAYDVPVYKVKTPAESKGKYDVFIPQGAIPADEAFAPLKGSPCPLVSQQQG